MKNRTLAPTLALTLLAGAAALAGPLNPPAGPVVSTYKTMTDVEPRTAVSAATTPGDATSIFKITQPGSYYLTGNITGVAGKSGVVIAASNVTLDLSGFNIHAGDSGVSTTVSLWKDIEVRNGSIDGCTGYGLDVHLCDDAVVSQVRIRSCGAGGIFAGPHARVNAAKVMGCTGPGIIGGADSEVSSCSVSDGLSSGPLFGNGIVVNFSSRVTDCTVKGNAGSGILGTGGSVNVSGCQSRQNGAAGIDVSGCDGGIVESCNAASNSGNGLSIGTAYLVKGCTASHNALDGITTGDQTVVERCTATSNTLVGFTLQFACTIRECQALSNHQQGIHIANGNNRVIGNTCHLNGASYAGIWIDASGCRVEDNHSTDNGYGIYVSAASNVLVRNTCTGNNNAPYFIASFNDAATVVNLSGAGIPSTATPWSNFSY